MGLKFRVFAEAPMDDVILGVDGQRFCRDGRQPAEVAARTRGKPKERKWIETGTPLSVINSLLIICFHKAATKHKIAMPTAIIYSSLWKRRWFE